MQFLVKGSQQNYRHLLEKYAETVFKSGLGKLKGITASLTIKPDVTPKFCKPRPVPFAVRPKVEETLEKW